MASFTRRDYAKIWLIGWQLKHRSRAFKDEGTELMELCENVIGQFSVGDAMNILNEAPSTI